MFQSQIQVTTRAALSIGVAAITFVAAQANAQLLAYDGFANGPVVDLDGSSGGTGWTSAWLSVGTDLTEIAGTGLSYPGLATSPGAAVTPVAGGTSPSSVYQRAFTAPSADLHVMYVSFLMRADTDTGLGGGTSFGAYPQKVTVGSPTGSGFFGLALSEGSTDVTNISLVPGATKLVVVRITAYSMPALLAFRMYVDPVVGAPEPGYPDADLWQLGSHPLPTSIAIDNSTGFTTDEIRIGTTWAAVLPADAQCVGDLNSSGAVDAADIGILLGQWGLPGGDLNGDDTTSAADVAILLGAWGSCS